ncbi:MAG: hypothetical protein U5K33_05465 [Halofilum sp. (in: g-proteobacteria)]|nr:hypothetical protein [Halofilum sp. (in: g-proteobacteria)]
MERTGWWSVVALAWLLGFSPGAFAASCRDKVAELDRLIEENQGLSEANLQAVRMQRDLGAQYCEQGNEATANSILDIPLRSMRQRADRAAAEQARRLPKSSLTVAYLKGDWCAWQIAEDASGRRDVARYHFYPDGSFHTGYPPSFRLDTSSDPRPRDRFLDQDYEVLLEKGADSFLTEVHGVRQYTWRRGGC